MPENFSSSAVFIWSVADLLRLISLITFAAASVLNPGYACGS